MKEYEKLAKEYMNAQPIDMVPDDIMDAYISAFLKCREMALDKLASLDAPFDYTRSINSIGQQEV